MRSSRHVKRSSRVRGFPLLAVTGLSLGVWGCGPTVGSIDPGVSATANPLVGQWTLLMTDHLPPGRTVYTTTLTIDEAAVITGVCADGSGQFSGTLRADGGIRWSGQVACGLVPGHEYPRILFYNGNMTPDSAESMSGQGSAATQESPDGALTTLVLLLDAARQQ